METPRRRADVAGKVMPPCVAGCSRTIPAGFRVLWTGTKFMDENAKVRANWRNVGERVAIFIGIMSVCAMIAAPNVGGDVIHRNGVHAVRCLSAYHDAQSVFSRQNLASIHGNADPESPAGAYASDFRVLYHGRDEAGEPLRLIEEGMAAAGISGNDAQWRGAAFLGYRYIEDPADSRAHFDTRFSLMAIPSVLGRTGRHVYWVDESGRILACSPPLPSGMAAPGIVEYFQRGPEATPRASKPTLDWIAVHPETGWERFWHRTKRDPGGVMACVLLACLVFAIYCRATRPELAVDDGAGGKSRVHGGTDI